MNKEYKRPEMLMMNLAIRSDEILATSDSIQEQIAGIKDLIDSGLFNDYWRRYEE